MRRWRCCSSTTPTFGRPRCWRSVAQTSISRGTMAVTIAPSAPNSQDEAGPVTKTGEVDDTAIVADAAGQRANRQVVKVTLKRWVMKLRLSARLFEIELPAYDQMLIEHARLVGARLRFTAHAARHGGPSTDFLLNLRDLNAIRARRRWRCIQSVRRYQKSGRLLRQIEALPPRLMADSVACANRLSMALRPPDPPYGNVGHKSVSRICRQLG